MNNNNNKKKNIKKSSIIKFFSMIVILSGLIIGIFFSSLFFSDNYKLGSDFKGYYSALVSVDNTNNDESTENQPNGNAEEGAKVLNDRLNPMGSNQIIIETAGKNFLKVMSPMDIYESETVFANQIQRNGGIVLLNNENKDMQISGEKDNITRKGISDYFTAATATTITGKLSKEPAISYDLNGDNFTSLFPSDETNQTPLNLKIMIDADGFFNDIRNFYKLISGDLKDRVNSFFDIIINPLRDTYKKSDEDTKNILFDLFYGKWKTETSGGINDFQYGSLITDDISNTQFLDSIVDSFSYESDTSKYVYDANAKTEDFKTEEGKYHNNIKIYKEGQGHNLVDFKRIDSVFSLLSSSLISFYNNFKDTIQNKNKKYYNNMESYFLFSGSILKNGSESNDGYIKDNKLYTKTQNDSKARIGASLFNASGKGFVFKVNSVATYNASVTKIMLIIGIVFMAVVALTLFIYMCFFYRLLGLFAMIITLAIIGTTLLTITLWFGLTIGPETIIAIFILVAINVEIFSLIFESMKENYFLKQRGLKTSFNLSVKENIALIFDIIVAILIPVVSMFWLTSNTIQSLAITLTIGSLSTIIFAVIIGLILFKLCVSTNILNKYPSLFALNTLSKGYEFSKLFLIIKINKIKSKIAKNISKNNESENVDLNKKLLVLEQKLEDHRLKLENKKQAKSDKKIAKLNIKLEKYNNLLKTIDKEKNSYKYQKLEFKIKDINYLIGNDVLESETDETIVVSSTKERLRVKSTEKVIYTGLKVLPLFTILVIGLSIILGFFVGVKYDNTFGGRTEYTLWGDRIDTLYDQIGNLDSDDAPNGLEEKIASLQNQFNEYKNENHSNDEVTFKKTQIVSEFINYSFLNNNVINYIANAPSSKPYNNTSFNVSNGTNFNYNKVESSQQESINWITLSVSTTDNSQSAIVKRFFSNLYVSKDDEPSAESGFITKRINPSTMLDLTIQLAYSVLALILALIIYIIIRFKWTYYVAMAIGVIATPLLLSGLIISLQIPFGSLIIIGITTSILFALTTSFAIFGKVRSLIASRNQKSLVTFFNKEVEYAYQIKEKKRQIAHEIFLEKQALKIKLSEKEHSREELRKLNLEFNKFAYEKRSEYKKYARENKELIYKVAKENNYLSEILVKTFKFGFTRFLLVFTLFLSLSLLLVIAINPILYFGIALILGVIISNLFILFLSLPIFIYLEKVRIRNNLARKRFINKLVVSNEEQIIEGIND
ncbi:protein translocase SecDF, variant type [Spiroplasma turonicum]|uniref:Bifunctional preprotein translocase subunit SecD/SecF n=1 Tax=Spiroplasma turonicum TaxID=216946 RepID=A0A0K1P6U4_9MOLU|nr:protein translocase SecDF, variant type [Spiroplasma turonicum]AKU79602.1 bifunctional preprotein translocase subunit SecD/SecF [Spiroplasma turonicum]ALX70624.1 bifunctional preprotein translocase subunit SecD/SecF [Spiroplasma turonicum]